MICENCSINGANNDHSVNCIVGLLDTVKKQCLDVNAELKEAKAIIEELRRRNSELQEEVESLKRKQQKDSIPKRRKTNSLDNQESLLQNDTKEEHTPDLFNEAISWDEICLEDSSKVKEEPLTEKQNNSTICNVLSPIGDKTPKKTFSKQRTTPEKNSPTTLPRRIKSDLGPNKSDNDENRNPQRNSSKWQSKSTDRAGRLSLTSKRNLGMAFLQPKIIEDLDTSLQHNQSKDQSGSALGKNSSNLQSNKMRQTRLNFNTVNTSAQLGNGSKDQGASSNLQSKLHQKQLKTEATNQKQNQTKPNKANAFDDDDDIFFEDIVAASQSQSIDEESLRIFTRKNCKGLFNYNPNNLSDLKSKSAIKAESTPIRNEASREVLPSVKLKGDMIKAEPLTCHKQPRVLPESPRQGDSSAGAGASFADDSSLVILPTQQDDVILVEDTGASALQHFDTEVLFKAMIMPTNDSYQFLKEMEKKEIEKLKSNKITGSISDISLFSRKSAVEDEEHKEATLLEYSKSDLEFLDKIQCRECKTYFRFLKEAHELSDEEIKNRIHNNCKHKDLQLIETPEEFWNPLMRSFSQNDPRNKTLVETLFINKK